MGNVGRDPFGEPTRQPLKPTYIVEKLACWALTASPCTTTTWCRTGLRWDDVDLSAGVLKVVAGKGGKSARVNLTPTLTQALEAVPAEERTGYVLPCRSRQAVYQRLEAACKQARVKFKGVHALRHASGTRLRDETGDLALVADHLRHSSLDTARGYAKANNQRLKKVLGEW